jgi:hypothetical protein
MKKILILTSLIFALVTISCQSIVLAEKTAPQTPKADPIQIKNSTLLIVAESIQPSGISLAYGIGTLVEYQGETFLVTHNHWGDMLQDQNLIELRDGDNRMIKPIYASEFKSLVVYRDAGTLVLRAPAGLAGVLTPASLDNGPQLKPGDTVQVAQRDRKSVV